MTLNSPPFLRFSATFEKKDGSRISFKDYYQERYNITVRNLNQPMLISMPKDKDKRRGDLSAVKIIPELTHMTGITDEQRANYQMMNVRVTNFHDFILSLWFDKLVNVDIQKRAYHHWKVKWSIFCTSDILKIRVMKELLHFSHCGCLRHDSSFYCNIVDFRLFPNGHVWPQIKG